VNQLKFVVRAKHIVSLGGYIVERNFPYRNLIVVNKTDEAIKIQLPVFFEGWIPHHEKLGLEIIPVKEEDSFLSMFRKAKSELEKIKNS